MLLKRLYQRFRDWQRNPRQYSELGSETHCCNNCGQEYAGSFCPRCGQKARAGRITWATVRSGLMDLFGLGGRSLPYSMWQLLWRPGYFISDYISGKWQVSFPPVKMLVLVALILYFVGKTIFPEYWSLMIEEDSTPITSTGWQYYWDYFNLWIGNHIEWMLLFVFSLLILPTWLVFRHSPRNARHTVPQGFFIQVFMTTEYIMWLFIISTCVKLSGANFGYNTGSSGFENLMMVSSLALIPLIVLINYKQIFGYSWWGTVWRWLVMLMIILAGFYAFCLSYISTISHVDNNKMSMIITLCILFFVICLSTLLLMIHVINRRLWREMGWYRAWLMPVLLVLISIGIYIWVENLEPDYMLRVFTVFFL